MISFSWANGVVINRQSSRRISAAPRSENNDSVAFQAKIKGLMGSGSLFLIHRRNENTTGRYTAIDASKGHLSSAASCAPRPGVQYPSFRKDVDVAAITVKEILLAHRDARQTGGGGGFVDREAEDSRVLSKGRTAAQFSRRDQMRQFN
mmetsp:Transcript_34757/g.86211  ORF Transcript_34757/g.86211 Transcript_34757/m.86211 type:complete len:149 (-) Transcript_34757:152-598(-)